MDSLYRQPARRRWLLACLGDFARWLLMSTLAGAAALAAGMFFIQHHLDEQIRMFVESKFQDNYSDFAVSVRSARRIQGHGVEIRGLRIARSGDQSEPLVTIDELFVECSTTLADLAAGQANASRIVVQGAKLTVTRHPDGRWSVEQLLPLPKFGEHPPPALIQNAVIKIVEPTLEGTRELTLRDVHVKLLPTRIATDNDEDRPLQFDFAGTGRGEHFEHADFRGHVRPDRGSWSLAGSIRSLEVSGRSLDALPTEARTHVDLLRPASGRVGLTFDAAQRNASSPVSFSVAGLFTGRIEEPRLPQALTDVRIPFHVSDQGIRIREATARAGRTNLRLSGSSAGFDRTSPFHIRAKAERLALDEEFQALLPSRMKNLWQKFSPQGLLDLNVELHSDGKHIQHVVVADLLDMSVAYHKFPYRVHHGRGQIRYRDDLLVLDGLEASANGRPVHLTGEIRQPGPNQLGWVEVAMDQPLPLDEQLLEALQGPSRQHVNSFHPQGAVTVWTRFSRRSLEEQPSWALKVGLHNCSVRYDRFQYPFYNIQGELSMVDKHWNVRIDQARNASAHVTCVGGWRPDRDKRIDLTLDFHGRALPIDDELRDALPEGTRRLWRSLQPRGSIDDVKVRVHIDADLEKPSIEVIGNKWPDKQNVDGTNISVRPTWLPYQWDHVAGTVHYKDGVTQLKRVVGTHGKTSVELHGNVASLPYDRWQATLTQVHLNSVRATPDLIAAIPGRLRNAIARLNPSGPIDISGTFGVGGEAAAGPTHSNWDFTCDVAGSHLNCGVPLTHVHGRMRLAGKLDSAGHYSRGHLEIDSMVHKGIQFTRLHGPISIDDARVAVGEKINAVPGEPAARPLSAETMGGTLTGSGQVWFAEQPWFEVEGTLFDGDLATIARDLKAPAGNLSGRTFAQVRLSGVCSARHTLQGSGRIQLRDADIYELPPMIQLLSILRVQPPDETAFTSSDVDFRVVADRIYFDRIDFDGHAISLDGRGDMSFDRQLSLTFETYAGPNDRRDWLIRPLLKEVGRNLVTIHVTGPLAEPHVSREAIPGVNRVIEQIFPSSGQPGAVTRLPTPRGPRRR